MNMQTAVKNRRFAFHHQNEALLFQFLLHECLSAHEILHQKPCPQRLSKVIGKGDHESNIWQISRGHLPRLRQYCTLFFTHYGENAPDLNEQLTQSLDKAHKVALQCHAFHEKNEEEQKALYLPLKKEVVKMFKLLFEKIVDYRDNASVLYFVLRKHQECDAAYNKPIIKQTLVSIFPQGLDQAHAFLTERFSQKGYEHLLPSIEEYLKKVDAELE